MVQFNELGITQDTQSLIVDVSIPNESYYEDVYIDSIVIDNQDTYVGTGVSSTPVYSYTAENNTKHVRLIIGINQMDCATLNGLFFIYVRTNGTYKPDTPCGCDDITTMATVTNLKPLYDNIMQYIREMGNNCDIPRGFIDQILKTKALEVAVRTKHYRQAIDIWKGFNSTPIIRKGGCGCRGAT